MKAARAAAVASDVGFIDFRAGTKELAARRRWEFFTESIFNLKLLRMVWLAWGGGLAFVGGPQVPTRVGLDTNDICGGSPQSRLPVRPSTTRPKFNKGLLMLFHILAKNFIIK